MTFRSNKPKNHSGLLLIENKPTRDNQACAVNPPMATRHRETIH